MIDINKICVSAVQENVNSFVKEVQSKPNVSEDESLVRVYKALMKHSELLLKKYHTALKEELKRNDVEI